MTELKDAVERVIKAFEALGRTGSIAEQLEAHRECERAMLALKQSWEAC